MGDSDRPFTVFYGNLYGFIRGVVDHNDAGDRVVLDYAIDNVLKG